MEPQGQASLCPSEPQTCSTQVMMTTASCAASEVLSGCVGGGRSSVAIMQEKAGQLQGQFVTVLTHTKICFVKKEARNKEFLSEFQVTLTTLPLSKKHEHLLFLKQEKYHIKAAKDVDGIFDILEPYWNYSDYALLEHIINEFGTSDLQEEMKKYIADLHLFEMKTTIEEFDAAALDKIRIPEHFMAMTITLGKDPTKYTLYEVRQFQNEVLNQSALNKFGVQVIPSSRIVLAFPPEAYADLSVAFDWKFWEMHKISMIEFSNQLEPIDVTTILTKQKTITKRHRRSQAFSRTLASKQYIAIFYDVLADQGYHRSIHMQSLPGSKFYVYSYLEGIVTKYAMYIAFLKC